VTAAVQLTRLSRRLVLLHLPHLDFAAHVWSQESDGYTAALHLIAGVWQALAAARPPGVVMAGTADPGHALLHRFSDDRLLGRHGGLTEEALRVPLLVVS
jgi:hypothetical protein